MSDFAVKLTVRNNRVLVAMRKRGIATTADLAKLAGLSYHAVVYLVAFKRRPTSGGNWTNAAWAISSALHVEPEELWPDHMKYLKASKSSIEFSTDEDGIRKLAAPSEKNLNINDVHRMIASLPERTGRAIALRFGIVDGIERTLDEVGEELGISQERARQIIAKGFRTIKHPKFRKGFDLDIDEPPSPNV